MTQTMTHNDIIENRIDHAFCEDGETLYLTIFDEGGGERDYKRVPNGRCYHIEPGQPRPRQIKKAEFEELYKLCAYRIERRGGEDTVIALAYPAIAPRAWFYPCCPYCGQQSIPDREHETQEAADEWAARHCKCSPALEYQFRVKAVEEREANIKRIKNSLQQFENFCEHRGCTLSDNVKEKLFEIAVLVLDGEMGKGNFNIGRIRAAVSKNGKGNIVIGFTYSDSESREV